MSKKYSTGVFGYIVGTKETGVYTALGADKITGMSIQTYLVDPVTHVPVDLPTESNSLWDPSVERLEDLLDILSARKALAESDERISHEDICRELGLDE